MIIPVQANFFFVYFPLVCTNSTCYKQNFLSFEPACLFVRLFNEKIQLHLIEQHNSHLTNFPLSSNPHYINYVLRDRSKIRGGEGWCIFILAYQFLGRPSPFQVQKKMLTPQNSLQEVSLKNPCLYSTVIK